MIVLGLRTSHSLSTQRTGLAPAGEEELSDEEEMDLKLELEELNEDPIERKLRPPVKGLTCKSVLGTL